MENIKLSKNFSLDELVTSPTATRLKIDNTPNDTVVKNLKELAIKVLQPIRDKYGSSIVVSSGYRSTKLNKTIGGSETSQHCVGQAADLNLGDKKLNKKLFELIAEMIKNEEIKVGQLINEYNYSWVHVSLPYQKVNQILSIS